MKTLSAVLAIILSLSINARGQEPQPDQLASRIDFIFSQYARTDAPGRLKIIERFRR